MAQYRIQRIEDYIELIGAAKVERIRNKAKEFKGLRVANFNSTYYGGGVAEMLSSMTLLMNSLGLQTEWRVIQGTPDFFSITKKMHNALQGGEIDLTSIKKEIFEQVIYENSVRNFIRHDFVIVHDPQPLPLIEHYEKCCPGFGAVTSTFRGLSPRRGNICGIGLISTMQRSRAVRILRRKWRHRRIF